MGKGWIRGWNAWDSVVSTAVGLSINIAHFGEHYRVLKQNLRAKEHDGNVFTVMQRMVYLMSNLSKNEHDLRDLIALAYAYYLKEKIRTNRDIRASLEMDFNLETLAFMNEFNTFVGNNKQIGEYENKRLSDLKKKDGDRGVFEEGNFENKGGENEKVLWEGIKQKFENDVHHQFKQKDLLNKFAKINNHIKRIIMNTYKDLIPRMYESYYDKHDSPEARGDDVRRALFESGDALKASYQKLLEEILYQDQFFSVYKHIFIEKGEQL